MNDREKMLLDWMRKIHQLEYAHCYQSIKYGKIQNFIGISAFLLSTFTAFYSKFPEFVDENINEFVKNSIIPFFLLMTAALTGFQAFFKPSEKAENHRRIGLEYEKLRHSIEIILTNSQNVNLDQEIQKIKETWDSMDTVYVNNKCFKDGKRKVQSLNKYPEELSFLPTVIP